MRAFGLFLLFGLSLTAYGEPACRDAVGKLFSQVVRDDSASVSKLEAVDFLVRLRMRVQNAIPPVGASGETRPSPLSETADGSSVVFQTGSHENAGKIYAAHDLKTIDRRIAELIEELRRPDLKGHFDFFETHNDLHDAEWIEHFLQRGTKLRAKSLLHRLREGFSTSAALPVCVVVPAAVLTIANLAVLGPGSENDRIAQEIHSRVTETTVVNLEGHLQRLREVTQGNPDAEGWIAEQAKKLEDYDQSAKKTPAANTYRSRFSDYESLHGVTNKDEFQIKAFSLATDGRVASRALGYSSSPGYVYSEASEANKPGRKNPEVLSRVGLLNEDEIREFTEKQAKAPGAFTFVAKLMAGVIAGGVGGPTACYAVYKHAPKKRPPLPGLEGFSKVLQSGHRGFAEETVWLDHQSPDGRYSAAVLEITHGQERQLKLTILSLDRPPRKPTAESAPPPAPPKPAAPESGAFLPLTAAPAPPEPRHELSAREKVARLKRELITHRFAETDETSFAPAQQIIDEAFASATRFNLTPQEFEKFADVVRHIETTDQLMQIDYSLRDIARAREREKVRAAIVTLILLFSLGVRGDESTCADGIHQLFARLANARGPAQSTNHVEVFLSRLDKLVEAATAPADIPLGATRPSPFTESALGSSVAFHVGDYERGGSFYSPHDLTALRKRLATVRKNFLEPDRADYRFFETHELLYHNEAIEALVKHGLPLVPREKEFLKLQLCMAGSAIAAFGGALFLGSTRDGVDVEIHRRVKGTTVKNLPEHLERLHDVTRGNPESEKWIAAQAESLATYDEAAKKSPSTKNYYSRHSDYESLREVTDRNEFQLKAYALATSGRLRSHGADYIQSSYIRLEAKEFSYPHTKPVGLLNEDELRERSERFTIDPLVPRVAELLGAAVAGSAAGLVACGTLEAAGAKLRPPIVGLEKFTTALDQGSRGFAGETIWLDHQSPDGTYSAALLEITRGQERKLKLTLLTFERPPEKPAVARRLPAPPPPAARQVTTFLPFGDLAPPPPKPVTRIPEAKFTALKRELITHRFADADAIAFAAREKQIDAAFAKAEELGLTPNEFDRFAKAVRGVTKEEDLIHLDYSLRDIVWARDLRPLPRKLPGAS